MGRRRCAVCAYVISYVISYGREPWELGEGGEVGEMGRRHDNKEEEDKLGWNSFARDAAGLFHLPLPEKLSG